MESVILWFISFPIIVYMYKPLKLLNPSVDNRIFPSFILCCSEMSCHDTEFEASGPLVEIDLMYKYAREFQRNKMPQDIYGCYYVSL